jgi:hypothetical protein
MCNEPDMGEELTVRKEGSDPPDGHPVATPVFQAKRFLEELPVGSEGDPCPPETAQIPHEQDVFRLCPEPQFTITDFYSHNAKGKSNPFPSAITACRWASCSVARTTEHLMELRKSPRMRKMKAVVKVTIGPSAGVVGYGNSDHIDFWPYADFDPCLTGQCVKAF